MKNAFGKKIYGQVGIDIGQLAEKLAKEMVTAGEHGRREHIEKQKQEQYTTTEELYCILRKYSWGVVIESLGTVLGQTLFGRGATEELAKADLRFNAVKLFVGHRAEKDWTAGRARAAKMNVYIADRLDQTGGLGSATGKISVGAGSK